MVQAREYRIPNPIEAQFVHQLDILAHVFFESCLTVN